MTNKEIILVIQELKEEIKILSDTVNTHAIVLDNLVESLEKADK